MVVNHTSVKMLVIDLTQIINLALGFFVVYLAYDILKLIGLIGKQRQDLIKNAKGNLQNLGLEAIQLNEYEIMIASQLVQPNDIPVSWSHIAGLEDVIRELKTSVLFPIRKKELFADSKLTRPPKGVLLYSPPGCGKTLLAKATARESGARFINLEFSVLFEKFYGDSQKLTTALFTLAEKIQPCIIFIDEIDSLLRSRKALDHEITATMKAQFLSLWDGLKTKSNCIVIIIGATNMPQNVDSAILRRMPTVVRVDMPDRFQRQKILELILDGEPVDKDVDCSRLADLAENFTGSSLHELCRNAATYRLNDYIMSSGNISQALSNIEKNEVLRSITMDDLLLSLRKMQESGKAPESRRVPEVFIPNDIQY